jgi:preprotein translocase subunit SecE
VAVEVKTMEVKKTQQLSKPINTQVKEATQKEGQWKDFLGDMKAEFAKISWTTPEELRSYTKIVVATTFLFGMGIYIMDLAIQLVLNSLEYVMRLIG